jgi:nucleolar complex protein 2
MDDMGRLLTQLLQPDGAGAGKVTGRKAHRQAKFQPETLPRWKKVEPLARSWLSSAHHLLTQLQDADITAYVLRSLAAAAPFAPPFPRRFKHLLRAALGRFGDGQPAVRVAAVTLIRSLAASASTEGLDSCLKGAYRVFAANAKFSGGGGGGQLEHVAFMASAVSELVSLDTGAAYPVAFSAIRQLALLLRNALSARTKDALRAVLCWQTVHCLELWGRVLSAHAAQPTSMLRPLVYPLVQVVTGAGRLVPTARYAPLRLRLLALLQRLGASTGVYIPIAMQAVEVLTFSEVTRAPLTRSAGGGSPSTGGYSALLRVQKAELRSPSFQAYVVDQGLDLVAEALAQWAYHPAFPELAHLPVRELRRGAKAMHTPALRRGALSVAEAAARNAEWVTQRREAASFAPKDCGPGSQALATFLAEQRAKNAAPLVAILEARRAAARQRAAAAHAVDVRIGGGERTTGADDGDEDGDADGEAQQGGSKRKRDAAQAPLSRKAALARQVAAFEEAEGNESGEDELAELDLSE